MKLRSLLGIICFGLLSSAVAGTVHTPKSTNPNANQKLATNNANVSSGHPYCGIYVYNNTGSYMEASGRDTFGGILDPFVVDVPQYINLDYDGFCHGKMQYLQIYVPPYQPIVTESIYAGESVVAFVGFTGLDYRVTN